MKQIPLSQGRFAIVDDEDYHYLSRFTWKYQKTAGLESVLRVLVHKFGRTAVRLEDYIVSRPIGGGGARAVNFKNGNRLDFRKENIEFMFTSSVKQRARKQEGATSQYKGVSFQKAARGPKWMAQIEKGKRGIPEYEHRMKFFNTEEEAARQYNKWGKELYGDLAYQNDV